MLRTFLQQHSGSNDKIRLSLSNTLPGRIHILHSDNSSPLCSTHYSRKQCDTSNPLPIFDRKDMRHTRHCSSFQKCSRYLMFHTEYDTYNQSRVSNPKGTPHNDHCNSFQKCSRYLMFHTEYDTYNQSQELIPKGSSRNGHHSNFRWCNSESNPRKDDDIGNQNRGLILKDRINIVRCMLGIRVNRLLQRERYNIQ